MDFVTVSCKFQIVLPEPVRKDLQIFPGQKMCILQYNGRIELIPEKDIAELKGFVKGINTEFTRDNDRL